MMKIWTVANQKGGVGKTTTAVTIGGLLAQKGLRTLLVDLDPHGSMTAYFGYDPDDPDNNVYTLFQSGASEPKIAPQIIRATKFDNLSLMPASTALATLDRQLGAQEGMGLILSRALAVCEAEFDYVLIDCPPVLGVLMVNALAASCYLLIPVQTEFLAIKGLDRMLRTLKMILAARKESLSYMIIPTMFDRRTRASVTSLRTIREDYADNVWRWMIPIDTQFREASRQGAPLSCLNPQARGVLAYKRLLELLLNDQSADDSGGLS